MKDEKVDPVIAAGIYLLVLILSHAWVSDMSIQEKIGISLLSMAISLVILTPNILNIMKETRRKVKSP